MIHILIPTTKQRRERLQKCIESIHQNAGTPHIISTYENEGEGFVTPCWKLLKDLKPNTVVWCIGDDTILTEPDTLKRLLAVYDDNNDCVIQPDDGIQHGAIITMPLCSAETMLRDGIHMEFFLNYCDNIFTEIMVKKGKYIYCSDVFVDHHHWVNNKAIPDETYAVAESKKEQDRLTYEQLHKELNL